MNFIHLHNHSEYSVLDGAITVEKLVNKAVEMGMPAIAMTDHGNMFGAIEFYETAKASGITPIIGEEFYITSGSRFTKGGSNSNEKAHHLILLAKNLTGYKNLLKLSSIAYTEGFYYKPRIDMEVLEKYSEGLICSTACLAGQIPSLIMRNKNSEAQELAGRFNEIFGADNFYLEMQYHGIPEQEKVNKGLIKISQDTGIPLIATNDAHYPNKEDSEAHDVLLCVQTRKTLTDTNRMRFHSNEFYLKSQEEMYDLFSDYPDALFNTWKIYEMMDLELELGKPILPNFAVPEGYNLDSYLKFLVDKGAKKRFGNQVPDVVVKRIAYELSVIIPMQFSGYFLIVWDVINYSKNNGIPTGPGRGSAAGSMVSYCLGITELDPLKYDLLFERFLNPDRNEMPDMDLDFCADRREEVIDYVKKKYGQDHVSQIVTFNRMKAKAVIKDVARVMDIPFQQANEISKLIEEKELNDSLNNSKEFQALYKNKDYGKELIDISLKLEGLVRSAGKHAAGVVISRGPLTDYVPLYRDRDGSISSQYEKNSLEKAGLVKMDFLGLKNLSIIDKCLKLINETVGEKVDITLISLDDKKTFELLQSAETSGVFQLESPGMQNLLRRLGPTCFEDIIAIVALFRPGPLKSGMTNDFIKRKRNPKLVSYPHKLLEPVLNDTLGVVVYQEQVMRISQLIGGFSLPEADKLRKAMGKKKIDIIRQLEDKFIQGALKNKINKKVAEDLYRMIEKFGEYGFNKSHSAAYALVTYQTAYLKSHYKLQYMTALLSAQKEQKDVVKYINDCRRGGIKLLPPSINDSYYDFTIEDDAIRFGLKAIKGVGSRAIDTVVKIRDERGKFSKLKDFLENIDSMLVNKGVLESLIKSGAMDCLHGNRAQLFDSIEKIIDAARELQEDKASGQGNLFGVQNNLGEKSYDIDLVDVPEWADSEKLGYEKAVLGFYVSGHPLGKYEKEIALFATDFIGSLSEDHNGKNVSLIGLLSDVEIKRAQKSGKRYALAVLEGLEGAIGVIFFGALLNKSEDVIKSSKPVMVSGTIEAEGDQLIKLIVADIKSLQQVKRESISAIHINFNSLGVDDWTLEALEKIFTRHHGECPIYFHVNIDNAEKVIKAHPSYNIQPSEKLVDDLTSLIGQESIAYTVGRR